MAKAKKTEETANTYQKQIEILNKLYGEGTIIGGTDTIGDLEVVDSGSLTLNIATGIGGLPVGKLIEIYGPESSGKSTCCLHFIAQFQKAGKKCLLVDFESSFDKYYAANLGVNTDDIVYSQPDYMEAGYDIISRMIQSGEIGLIVLDSHTTAPPKKTFEEELDGNATMALQARINSQALLKIKPLLLPNHCTLIAVSQLRSQIGSQTPGDKPTGGNSYKFYSDMRFKIWKILDKEGETNKTTIDVVKNKCAPPFGKAEFKIEWGKGISRNGELLDLAVELDFIKKGGAWYSYEDVVKLQGSEKFIDYMNDNPEWTMELEQKVLTKLKGK